MEVTNFFLDQNVPIPFPENIEDPRNYSSVLLQQVIATTEVPPDADMVDIKIELLEALDKLPAENVFDEVSSIAKFSELKVAASQGEAANRSYRDLGVIAMTLMGLYRPPKPRAARRRGQNNPFSSTASNGSNLSYQPGAVQRRTGRR